MIDPAILRDNPDAVRSSLTKRGGEPTLVEPERSYMMTPGDAHFYDVGDVHSPRRENSTKLVRIEGANLDHIKRSNIKAA